MFKRTLTGLIVDLQLTWLAKERKLRIVQGRRGNANSRSHIACNSRSIRLSATLIRSQ